jgi:Ca-activated chloride channel family protein
MSFIYPEYLALIIPLGIFFYKIASGLKNRTHLIILMLLFISLSRPVMDKQEQESIVEGRDIVIALDVSYSMRADDLKPNRYEYAKECIKELLVQNLNDNVMLMVFTTNPLLLSPPSTDHALLTTALDALEMENILTKGTSLVKLFEMVEKIGMQDKNFILITDGGEESDLATLVSMIKNQTKSFSILGLGDNSGSTIKKDDGTLLKDDKSHLVVSRVNPILKELASQIDGNYIEATSSAKESAKLLDVKLEASNEVFTKKEYKYIELYQYPLFLGTLLFLAVHTKGVRYLIIFLTFFGLNANASILDNYYLSNAYKSYNSQDYKEVIVNLKKIKNDTLQSRLIEANTLYKLKDYERALKAYLSIKTTSTKVKQNIYYNIANCFASLGNYRDARAFYAKTLQLGSDKDASHNMGIVVFMQNRDSKGDGKTMPQSKQKSSQKGDAKLKNKNTKEKQNNEVKDLKQKYPISSKSYELINKGYINESKPW